MEPIIGLEDNQEIVNAFLTEADETLARFEELLIELEQDPADDERLSEIFRAAHTLKGNASCLQFEEMTAFAHVVEGLLEQLRERTMEVTPVCITRLLDAVDALRDLAMRSVGGDATLTPSQQQLMNDLASGAPCGGADFSPMTETGGPKPAAPPIRVSMDKLDRMLDLTGEIAVARSHVRQLMIEDLASERALDALRELDRLSFDLQELVMNARLVPLGPALRHFHRIIRDVAASQQKRVSLVIEGGDVEVDTTVIEHLRSPITHMLRNAIDHGIELPAERAAAGKPPAGTIRISAMHEAGGVTIRFSDDGKGLDERHITERALALGLDTTPLSRQELLTLIFEPGFTTAREITDISGRGVGLDIVRRDVEALRGTLSLSSETGTGTTFTIRLPLTVTVIEGFGVCAGGETYVIPMEAVVECMEMPAGDPAAACGVLEVRGEPLPFLRLRTLFALDAPAASRENVVIVQNDQVRAGIVVDELLGGTQTVMKPLGGLLRQLQGVAGSSILGTGLVALVLDPHEVIRLAAANN